ncbi:MAG TPA: hypothetical protein VL961_05280 [Acidimicrobiales bacterium]|nr:hypothetical protein [Acidimicrobiales bacterium]
MATVELMPVKRPLVTLGSSSAATKSRHSVGMGRSSTLMELMSKYEP